MRGRLNPVKEARRRARQGVGMAPIERVVPDKHKKVERLKAKTPSAVQKVNMDADI